MPYKLQHKQNKNIISIFDEINQEKMNQLILHNGDSINDYEIIEFTPIDINTDETQLILNKLSELDLIVPRIVEDIVSQGNFIIHQSKLDIINQKNILRQQLAELNSR